MFDPGWLPEEEDEIKRYLGIAILVLATIWVVVR